MYFCPYRSCKELKSQIPETWSQLLAHLLTSHLSLPHSEAVKLIDRRILNQIRSERRSTQSEVDKYLTKRVTRGQI